MTRANALRVCALLAAIGALVAVALSRHDGDAAPTAEGEHPQPVAVAQPPGLAPAPRREGGAPPSGGREPEQTAPVPGNPQTAEALALVKSLDACVSDAQKAVECIPRAIEALHDADEGVRAAAARVLATVGRPAVEPLIAAVRQDIAAHGNEWTTFPTAASVAFDGLVEAGADLVARALAEPQVEFWAATTLGRAASLRKDLQLALPVLQELLRGENERARQWAAQAVPAAGPGTDRVVPDLARCLQPTNVQTRLEAVQALRRIGPPASSALSDLRALSDDPHKGVRRFALEAIGAIEGR